MSRVWAISYTTYFGAGVKYDEIKNGLIERFGKPEQEDSGSGSMNWNSHILSTSPAIEFSARVFPPNAGGFCKLTLQLSDKAFSWKSGDLARQYEYPAPSSSPLDTTKPSY